jgi:hypothetical protein
MEEMFANHRRIAVANRNNEGTVVHRQVCGCEVRVASSTAECRSRHLCAQHQTPQADRTPVTLIRVISTRGALRFDRLDAILRPLAYNSEAFVEIHPQGFLTRIETVHGARHERTLC